MSLKDAMDESRRGGKILFVEAYTTWCGPCKFMEKEVFPNNELEKPYSEFICVRIDIEEEENLAFSDTIGIDAIPAFIFISPNGKILHKKKGALSVEEMILLAGYGKNPESHPFRVALRNLADGKLNKGEKIKLMRDCAEYGEQHKIYEIARDIMLHMGPDSIFSSKENLILFYLSAGSIEKTPAFDAYLKNYQEKHEESDYELTLSWISYLFDQEFEKLADGERLKPEIEARILEIGKTILNKNDFTDLKARIDRL